MLGGLVFRGDRNDVHQTIAGTEMLKILSFCFLAFADDIDNGSALAMAGFIGIIFFSHSCLEPPMNGIAPKRPCR